MPRPNPRRGKLRPGTLLLGRTAESCGREAPGGRRATWPRKANEADLCTPGGLARTSGSLAEAVQRFAPGPRPGEDTATFQRQFAQFMLDQSEQLLVYGDLDSAERAASRARQIPVQYGAQERSPEKVLQAIARLREKREAPGHLASGDTTTRLPATLPSTGEGAGQEQVRRLVAQAGMELDRGNLKQARQLAEEAREMNVALSPSETQPWQLLLEVEARERRRNMVKSLRLATRHRETPNPRSRTRRFPGPARRV
jgi:hypothetical protein